MSTSPAKPKSKQQEEAKPPTSKEVPHSTLSAELEMMLHAAFVNARYQRHEFLTVEHLLLALLDVASSEQTLTACGADVDELKSQISLFIDENTPVADPKGEVDTAPTLGFQRVIQRAIMRVHGLQQPARQVDCNDVLLALFGEKESHAVYFLHQQGITRLDIANFISHGIRKDDEARTRDRPSAEIIDETSLGRVFFNFVSDATKPFVNAAEIVARRPKLFISYSHVDTACLDRLLVHLKPLERTNTLVCWSDKRIRTGDKWKTELENNLSDAVIAILLVSADFLASDFIVNNELPPLLINADSRGLRILPVILKPCGFRRDPVLSTFQSANDPATPLLGMTLIEQEAIYDRIAEEVAREIGERRGS